MMNDECHALHAVSNSSFILSNYPACAAGAQAGRLCRSKMGKMGNAAEHHSLSQRAEAYWTQSRRPLSSLLLVAPLLAIYEAAVLLLGAQNGADSLMRWLLERLGFGQHLLLPIATVCTLLAWQYLSHQPWRFSPGVLAIMVVESVLLGLCLRLGSFAQNAVLMTGYADALKTNLREAAGFLGAGIYEELLFRLILLSLTIWGLRRAGVAPRTGVIVAVVLNGLLFAAAHHIGPGGESPIRWPRFAFRTMAGIYFSVIFLYRGFGIAAGSHAAYDLLTGL
jgi:membrane protease YdiL (CAAX protease family)